MKWLPLCLALLGIAPGAGLARGIHYGGVTDPGLLACDQRQWQGEVATAQDCYRRLLGAAGPTAIRAEAAWALDDLQAANAWFQNATAAAPGDAGLRVRWGWLFAQTHQAADAQALFSEALKLQPGNGYAQVGLASALADNFSARATELAQTVAGDIKMATGARIQAQLLLARLALEESRPVDAAALLDVAAQWLQSGVWPQLELLALRAAVAAVNEQPLDDWVNKAQKQNRHFGEIYAVPAYFMVVNRHYEQAITWLQRALEVQPELWAARRELAVNLLRVNRVDAARQQLELAYAGDPFDPRTVNTLRLLDSFDQFELRAWPAEGQPQLLMRLHRSEAAALAPYVGNMARAAIREFSDRYGYTLEQPMVVELYPHHEDFAVRTVGLPGIGILGATFGYLLAMDSPAARSADEFHWGTTLWHEVAHVFTLKASEHRVSRWFSEGMSVYEEWHSGPLPGRRIPLDVLGAMAEDKFLPVAQLDGGFVRPTYPQQVLVSYMQAGLVCEFIEQAFGFERLLAILEQYRLGADTVAALETSLKLPMDQIESAFRDYVSDQFGGQLATLGAWREAHSRAASAAAEGNWRTAEVNARLAVSLLPEHVEADSDHLILARSRAQAGDRDGELAALETFWRNGGHQPEALLTLAIGFAQSGKRALAIDVLKSLHNVAPLTESTHTQLGEWLMAEARASEALLEFEVAQALEPLDRAAAQLNLARAQHALGHAERAREHVLAALEIAPHYREAQKLLLVLTRAGPGS